MRKFLEVLVDEDGKFHFSTDGRFPWKKGVPDPSLWDQEFRQVLRDLTELMWRNPQQEVSAAVRMLAMAEILGSSQPYDQAEEFWSVMMFDTIPQYEGFTAQIKRPFGFDDRKVARPIVGGDVSLFSPSTWQSAFPMPSGKGMN